jgi:energy-coupling factor transporter ATP-binding protein EcfA2
MQSDGPARAGHAGRAQDQLELALLPVRQLAPLLVRELGCILVELRRDRRAILLVEQNLAFALRVADSVYLMSKGRIVHACTPGGAPPGRRHQGALPRRLTGSHPGWPSVAAGAPRFEVAAVARW